MIFDPVKYDDISLPYETDWLGSNSVFYNTSSGQVSRNINDVIETNQIEFCPTGLSIFLKYGYAAFGYTPILNVHQTLPNSKLKMVAGNLVCATNESLESELYSSLDGTEEVENVMSTLHGLFDSYKTHLDRKSIRHDEIILPLSGGFDSRLLAVQSVKSELKPTAYTFGASANQTDSGEVVIAKKIAEQLGFPWKNIQLENLASQLPTWFDLFGVSTHAHGLNQLDFYSKISRIHSRQNTSLISGLIGDAWAGMKPDPLESPEQLFRLGLSYGFNAPLSEEQSKMAVQVEQKKFESMKEWYSNPKWCLIESMRLKMTLLKYLIVVPNHFNISVFTPFTDQTIARQMMCLPNHMRQDRRWQKEIFSEHALLNFDVSKTRDFHFPVLSVKDRIQYPFEPLNENGLNKLLGAEAIHRANRVPKSNLLHRLFILSLKVSRKRFLHRISKFLFQKIRFDAGIYLTLYPINEQLKRVNNHS